MWKISLYTFKNEANLEFHKFSQVGYNVLIFLVIFFLEKKKQKAKLQWIMPWNMFHFKNH